MSDLFYQLILFAQDAAKDQPAPQQAPPGSSLILWLPVFLIIFMLFQFFFGNPNRREQKRVEDMKKTLKKNDPVVTAGGILGTVANIHADRNEVTIRVDDNAKLRMQMRSVYPVSPPEKTTSAEQKGEPKTEAAS